MTTEQRQGLDSIGRAMLADSRRPAVAARVVDIKGFSTWAGDELVVVGSDGVRHGSLLGDVGAREVLDAAAPLLDSGTAELATAVVEIHGAAVAAAGLACGGRAELLLQPTSTVPRELWRLLAGRSPVALLTRIGGPGRAAASLVVDRQGRTWGAAGAAGPAAIEEAARLLGAGHSTTRRVEEEAGTVLVEVWVPAPRLVVVGTGEMIGALAAQGALLGWEARAVEDGPARGGAGWASLDGALEWAGASAAVVLLSHDPHVDVPALGAALDAGVPYVGAMGSRSTQSRRLDRLRADGRSDEDLARIHRPIGLDLGGRSAPETALAICAEVLAEHCGRDAKPLRDRRGPIHDRPTA